MVKKLSSLIHYKQGGIMFFLRGAKGVDFVNRGNFATADFTIGDFTKDNTWRELDLTSVIPAGCKCVLVRGYMQGTTTNLLAAFRTAGNADIGNAAHLFTFEANKRTEDDIWLIPNDIGVIEYKIPSTVDTALSLYIRGWLK